MVRMLAAMAVLAGCGGSNGPLTCKTAFDQYYAIGCVLDEEGSNQPVDGQTAVAYCNMLSSAGSACTSELQAWLTCTDDAMAPTTSSTACNCSAQLQDLTQCEAAGSG
jgi:hypothetical protein